MRRAVELKSMWSDTALSIANEYRHSDVVAMHLKHGAK